MRFFSALAPLAILASRAAGIAPRDTTKQAHAMMAGILDIDPVPASVFDPFFDNDHFPRLFKVPGFLSNSRFDAIDGQQPEQITLFDVETPEIFTSAPWVYFDTHRPDYELDIISKVNTSDFLYLALDGAPVGSVKGPSVMAFIQYNVTKGMEDFVKGGVEYGVIPYLKSIKGFQRARKYTLQNFAYVHRPDRPAPPTNLLVVEFKNTSGALNTPAFKGFEKAILNNPLLSSPSIRLYKTRNTYGPWA